MRHRLSRGRNSLTHEPMIGAGSPWRRTQASPVVGKGASPGAAAVGIVNSSPKRNGHIGNDTPDISRPIRRIRINPIAREWAGGGQWFSSSKLGGPCCCRGRHHANYTRTTQALPGGSRSEPVTAGWPGEEMPAPAVIQGGSRLYRLSLYRPVTPEVAGSSPVAPAINILQISRFCCPAGRKRPPAFFRSCAHRVQARKVLSPGVFVSARRRGRFPIPHQIDRRTPVLVDSLTLRLWLPETRSSCQSP